MQDELQRIQLSFFMTGCLAGVSCGMLFGASGPPLLRIELEVSIPLAVGGGLIGAFLGRAVSELYKRITKTRALITIISAAFLFGGIGAVIGWIVGDRIGIQAIMDPYIEIAQERIWARRLMAQGAMIGVALGLLLGAIHWSWQIKRPPSR
jgi:hypothetical protein